MSEITVASSSPSSVPTTPIMVRLRRNRTPRYAQKSVVLSVRLRGYTANELHGKMALHDLRNLTYSLGMQIAALDRTRTAILDQAPESAFLGTFRVGNITDFFNSLLGLLNRIFLDPS
jgi:hypothetical protein